MNISIGGFLFSASALMIILKLIGYFPFSWWVVFSPLLAAGLLMLVAIVFTALGYALISWSYK